MVARIDVFQDGVPDCFRGHSNFMTPEKLGYFSGRLDSRTVYIELSSGTSIIPGSKRRLYGVSFRFDNGKEPSLGPKKLSRCFYNSGEAVRFIMGGPAAWRAASQEQGETNP